MDKKEEFVQEVINIIINNISDGKLNGAMIAKQMNISRMHLHRQLKHYENCNTREFILKIRLEHAKVKLRNTNKLIYVIARESGFHNASFFSKKFKELTGILPKKFRYE